MIEKIIIDNTEFLPIAEKIIRKSLDDNFTAEGRYGNGAFGGGKTKWEKSLRVKKHGGLTLSNTGKLRGTLLVNASSSGGIVIKNDQGVIDVTSDANIDISISSPLDYAETLNDGLEYINNREKKNDGRSKTFLRKDKNVIEDDNEIIAFRKLQNLSIMPSAERTVQNYKILIPKRPFMVVQDEDLEFIQEKYMEWING